MTVSVVVPCFNSADFLRGALASLDEEKANGAELEVLVMDGGSTDETPAVLETFASTIDVLRSEPDQGPADAINKGFDLASGDILAWLNADDRYISGAVVRAQAALKDHPGTSFVFGKCPIVTPEGEEIRKGITRFKEAFFPISSRFTFQCINYISQPSCFFRAEAVRAAGPLRLDLKAAWDYEFLLRIWREGPAKVVYGNPLAQFCWHPESISGQHFRLQFAEEYEAAKSDAGRWAPQTLTHWLVRHGIVGAYGLMQRRREK
jgi:glycosyltransferase involved in cell wall biosynthesis